MKPRENLHLGSLGNLFSTFYAKAEEKKPEEEQENSFACGSKNRLEPFPSFPNARDASPLAEFPHTYRNYLRGGLTGPAKALAERWNSFTEEQRRNA